MIFPKWAPDELVDYYRSLIKQNNKQTDVINREEIVLRLITRPEMEKVWLWESKLFFRFPLTANGGIVGSLLRHYENFNLAAKATSSERISDFLEIKSLARQLSVKMSKYKDEALLEINYYRKLIPKEYDLPLVKTLKDEYQKKLAERKKSSRSDRDYPFWDFTLPPMFVLLANLSDVAGNDDPNFIKYPTKIKQKSALQTHLIRKTFNTSTLLETVPPSIAATLISVALDEPSINADGVRKVFAEMREERKKEEKEHIELLKGREDSDKKHK